MFKKKNIKYTFIEEDKFTDTRVSLALSVGSLAVLRVTVLISFIVQAQGGIALGCSGLIAMLFSFYAFYLGMRALSQKTESIPKATLSALASGIMSILWVVLFLLGIH